MRALSIRQPWASLIFAGKPGWKNIENRHWGPFFRTLRTGIYGKDHLWIHAGSTKARAEEIERANKIAYKAGLFLPPKPEDYRYGGYLGTVRFIDVIHRSSSPWFEGPCGWVFADPYPMPFLEGKGQPGLFVFDSMPMPNIPKTDTERWLVNVPAEEAAKEAKARGLIHQGHRTERFYSNQDEEDTVGIQPEIAFEILSGLKRDKRILVRGDKGKDFVGLFHGTPTTIDVKGGRQKEKKYELMMPLKEEYVVLNKVSDLYVFATVEGDWVQFHGWCTLKTMLACPISTFGKRRIPNYLMRAAALKPMEDLLDYLEPLEV